jgi:hypothetical protein
MYGGSSNNNEIMNILKEERLFKNLSKKQKMDLERIRLITAEKVIEEIIRQKMASGFFPN